MNNEELSDHAIEINQAFDEGIHKAIPLIIKQVEKEVRQSLIEDVEKLLKHSQYFAYNTDYLNGIKSALDVLKQDK